MVDLPVVEEAVEAEEGGKFAVCLGDFCRRAC
ncbi:hypothetical protein FBZ99_103254 [Rhizobium sp. ERR 1071]|nr:hypothetical protein FBZ99_103254 [Rhizobium sp. ERR1071]